MGLLGDDRGQAVQVGAILLFGFLVIGLSLYQATVVPQETKSTEFEAYLDASNDLVSLHDDVVTAATRNVQSGTTVQTGVRYPRRVLFVNPGPPTGSLSMSDPRNVTITGAEAVDSEPEAVRSVWDGSERVYENNSSVLRYSPDYNEFDGTDISVSGVSVQRETGTATVPLAGQSLINGNRITIVAIEGQVGQTSVQTPLSVRPVSAATRTVTVTNTSGGTIDITLPVGTNATAWNRSATADRLRERGAPRVLSVTDVDDGEDSTNSLVRVVLNGSYTYELRMAKVEVSSASAASTVSRPQTEYLVRTSTGPVAVPNETTELVVEARDRYNNPVEGETVTFDVVSGNATPAGGRNITTNDEGRAPFRFTTDGDASAAVAVEAESDFDRDEDIGPLERVRFTAPVVNGNGSGTGAGTDGSTSEINPPNDYEGDVILDKSAEFGAGGSKNGARITLHNTDVNQSREITRFRVSFYYPDGKNALATGVQFNGSPQQDVGAQLYNLSSSGDSVTLPADSKTDVDIVFSPSSVQTNGDFFILTVEFAEAKNGDKFATYFVAVPK